MLNSNRVKPDELSKALLEYLQDYKEDIDEEVVELSNKYIKEARKELKSISPVSSKDVRLKGGGVQTRGSYAGSWSVKNGKKITDVYSKVVSNSKYYRLTHLLEFGHANRDGSRTAPIPHIRKTEDKYREKFIQELEKKIRRQ